MRRASDVERLGGTEKDLGKAWRGVCWGRAIHRVCEADGLGFMKGMSRRRVVRREEGMGPCLDPVGCIRRASKHVDKWNAVVPLCGAGSSSCPRA